MFFQRKHLHLLLVFPVLLLGCVFRVEATQAEADAYPPQLLSYYLNYGEDAQTDIDRLVSELTDLDPAQGQTWGRIMEFWSYANNEMPIPADVLPDGLPEDDSLCIVVLGYQLGPYGIIKPELAGRLEVALASAEKYPNAYVLCTGGPINFLSYHPSEAGQMEKWLINHGLAPERIITETMSLSTTENAVNSCKLLMESYPQIRTLALVSSDYHLSRSCVYFYTQALLEGQARNTAPLELAACAAYPVSDHTKEDLDTQAAGIAELTGVSGYQGLNPQLSQLTGISLDGEFTYLAGSGMHITVEASYDSGFCRDVTTEAVFSGVDMNTPGEQLLQVRYTENGITATIPAVVSVLGPAVLETEAPAIQPATGPVNADIPTSTQGQSPALLLVLAVSLAALALFLIRRKCQKSKCRPGTKS